MAWIGTSWLSLDSLGFHFLQYPPLTSHVDKDQYCQHVPSFHAHDHHDHLFAWIESLQNLQETLQPRRTQLFEELGPLVHAITSNHLLIGLLIDHLK